MPDLWIPDSARINSEVDSQLESLNERHKWLKFFDRELQAMDEHLSLVKASDEATEPGLVPGYWHIRRHNPGDMATYIPLRGPNGEFVEPGSEHLEMMRRIDLHRPGAFDEFVRAGEAHLRRIEDERKARADERRVEFAERLESVERAHVSMKEGWTNSVKGKKAKP